MADLTIQYTIRGQATFPAGSKLTETETGVILPNGDIVKIWEAFELHAGGSDDETTDLSYDECAARGIHYDGDMADFQEVL